ncbi:MAG: hypothetical protein ACQESF_01000 [Nanobdellota archaeon]
MFHRKSQLHSIDFIFSGILFIIVFFSLVSAWDNLRYNFSSVDQRNDFEIISRYAFSSLTETRGVPNSWHINGNVNSTEVSSLGLLGPEGSLMSEKLEALSIYNSTSYQEYKKILGIKGPGYEFSLNATYFYDNLSIKNITTVGYLGKCDSVVRITRAGTDDDGNIVKLRYKGCIK